MSNAPTLAGYHHLGLTVRDIAASEAWYADTLGLVRAFVEKHDNESGYAVVMTSPGTSFFLGLDHHAEADRQVFDARRTGLDHVAFGAARKRSTGGPPGSPSSVSTTTRSSRVTTRCRWRW